MKTLLARTAALVLFLGAGSAFGAEDHHGPHVGEIVYPAINFLIFAYIIKRFAIPPVLGFLSARRDSVVRIIREAADGKARAEAIVNDYRDRLARLDDEIQRIHSELRAEGERDQARIRREAEELAAKIRSDASSQAEQEFKAARHRLRLEIARLAQKAAETVLRSHLTDTDQKRLADEFIAELGEVR